MTDALIRSFAPKDPEEEDSWEIDFSDRMPPSDSIATIVDVFLGTGDGINDDAAMAIDRFAFSGQSVSGWFNFGTRGTTYRITARIASVEGRKLDKSGDILIADT